MPEARIPIAHLYIYASFIANSDFHLYFGKNKDLMKSM